MKLRTFAVLVAVGAWCAPATPVGRIGRAEPPDRLPAIPADRLTETQKRVVDQFQSVRRTGLFGPFVPLVRSPELLSAARAMGDYLRYQSALPAAVKELVILLVAREWTQQVEWQIHYPEALKAGLSPALVEAVAQGRRPPGMSEDEEAAWDFTTELLHQRAVSDPTYTRALRRFGEQGVVDLAGTSGYYVFLAGVMNAARTAPTGAIRPALAPLTP